MLCFSATDRNRNAPDQPGDLTSRAMTTPGPNPARIAIDGRNIAMVGMTRHDRGSPATGDKTPRLIDQRIRVYTEGLADGHHRH
jgi:hypothetical protein